MCCSRALYMANQIYFAPPKKADEGICVTPRKEPEEAQVMPGLTPSLTAAPLPFFPQAELTCFPRWASAHLLCPFLDRRGRAGRRPTTLPSTSVGCRMLSVALEAKFSLLQM